jgi:hypothetical protein
VPIVCQPNFLQISQYESGQREPTMMLVLAYARFGGYFSREFDR